MNAWAIKFLSGVPYYTGRGLHGHIYAADSPERAKQFLSREQAAASLPIIGIDGSELPALVVPVPTWAINY